MVKHQVVLTHTNTRVILECKDDVLNKKNHFRDLDTLTYIINSNLQK